MGGGDEGVDGCLIPSQRQTLAFRLAVEILDGSGKSGLKRMTSAWIDIEEWMVRLCRFFEVTFRDPPSVGLDLTSSGKVVRMDLKIEKICICIRRH